MGHSSQQTKTSLLFFLALANLLSAFGGGTVLMQALEASKEKKITVFGDDAMIAFLVGTVFGLILVTLLRSSRLEGLRSSRLTGGIITLSSAAMSLLLIIQITWLLPSDGRGDFLQSCTFLLVLVLRFGFGFVPRSLRVDAAAGYGQRIGWVEHTYALGMVLGLIAWRNSGGTATENLKTVLYFDVGFQIAAGILDILSRHMSFSQRAASKASMPREVPLPIDWSLFTKISMAAISLTIGIQIVMFECRDKFGPGMSPKIMASFYFGAALASLVYSQIDMKLLFLSCKRETTRLVINRDGKQQPISFALVTFIPAAFLLFVIIGNVLWPNSVRGAGSFLHATVNITFMLMLAAAAFFLEFIILSIFDFIGEEGLKRHRQGLVALTFGLMGMGGAVFVVVIHKLGLSHGPNAHYSWMIAITVCVIITNLAIRSASKQHTSNLIPQFSD
jgi:hypothetical protein